ncbi:retrovirus-related pol polyprotein from transposon TNT 1-94 [Tanacetum coccineum]|uniref:Retrovirus-related pol polyprotein from transposon TNT 1-94 n=1 Tax=Tanacetum coccineum TaxID=301880 RepID=A0ABQ5EZJ6_9ASTR
MLTKPQVFYDNILKQALGFQNPFYLKKAKQIRPILYDSNVISKETNLNRLSKDFGKRFIPQRELSDKQALHPITDQSASLPVKIEALRELPKLDPVILAPKVKNNKEAHEYYLKHTMEQAAILRELIQELLGYVRDTCPDIHKPRVNPSTSGSGSKPSGNTKNDRILRKPSSNEKNKVEVQSRKVKSSLNKSNSESKNVCNEHVKHPVKGAKALYSDEPPTKQYHLRVPYRLEVVAPKQVVTRVYTRRPKVPKSIQNSKPKVAKSMTANRMEPDTSRGSDTSIAPSSSSLIDCSTVKFSNDQVAMIMGYGDYQIGNVTISRVYYVEGLGHNLFSVGQFCDLDLEVAFQKHTCFVRNLEGVDLLSGYSGTNLFSLSIRDMMASSPICLLSKAIKTKSWLWHRRLSHLNFGAINHLARHGLVRGLPRLKLEKRTNGFCLCQRKKASNRS